MELIELKSTIIEITTTTATTGWIGSVGEKMEEDRIYEHEDKSIKFTQSKKQRKELDPTPPKKEQSIRDLWNNKNETTFISSELQNEKGMKVGLKGHLKKQRLKTSRFDERHMYRFKKVSDSPKKIKPKKSTPRQNKLTCEN